jgi:hypothetical protein
MTMHTDQELVSLDSGSGPSSSGTTSSCSRNTTNCRFCGFGHCLTYIYANGYVMLGHSDSGAQQLALSNPIATPVEQVMVQVCICACVCVCAYLALALVLADCGIGGAAT